MTSEPPKVYISYGPGEAVEQWVEDLATRLRTGSGIDATISPWELHPGDQIPQHLETAVRENTFIVLICTPEYRRQFDERLGEIGYAAGLMTGEAFRLSRHRKYVPVLREGRVDEAVPAWLQDRGVVDLRGTPYSENEYVRLADRSERFLV